MTTAQLHLEIPADEPLILFSRFFATTPERLWRAWTEPQQIARWMGPRYLETRDCEVDLRVGGTWRFVHVAPDGTEHGFHGEFTEVDAPRRLARTFVYEPWPEAPMQEWLELEAVEGGTLMRGGSRAVSVEARDRHVESGMEGGMTESYERLDELLAVEP